MAVTEDATPDSTTGKDSPAGRRDGVLKANGLSLAWESHGPDDTPVMLLVHGLGVPLNGWPPALVERLVASGYRVVLFDNRDIGRSELLTSAGIPNAGLQWLRSLVGLRVKSAYTLDDMMRDTVGLLDGLGIDKAHVVGVSMGGMISQLVAANHRQRVLSLTSIMSTTGKRRLPGPDKTVRRHMLSRPVTADPGARIAHGVRTWELIGSPAWRMSRGETEAFLKRLYDRGVTADGVLRQMVAIMASPPRNDVLGTLDLPALVIHGDADPLLPLACGKDTAQAIPGAELRVFEGMGHDLPDALIPEIAAAISRHAARADERSGTCRAA